MLPTNLKERGKKMLKKCIPALLVTISFFLIWSPSLFADDNHALPMLRMGVSARALAMGGAYVAETHDASAGYWNPAGLSQIEFINLTAMYSASMSYDRQYNYFAYGQRFDFGAVGLSWLGSGIKDVEEYGSLGDYKGNFNAMDNVFLFSYGNEAGKFLIGGTFKVINQKFDYTDSYSKTGVGFDAGLKYQATDEVTLGVAFKDLGTKVGGDRVPADYRFGAALYPLSGFTFTTDVEKIEQRRDLKFHFGGEYTYEFTKDYFASLRGGVSDGSFALGCGLKIYKFDLDYAYVTESEDFLKENHRISLSVTF
jgi:hypothetical protein